MAILKSFRFGFVLQLMMLLQIHSVICYQYKVGDLDAWGLPATENSQIYMYWSKYHSLKIGDSLMFLYPPSQDSVIQVTKESYNSCNLKDPILYMKDGNSLFNITDYGDLFFTSGVAGHCEKNQKLHISVLSGNGSSASAPSSDGALPEISPSYPTVFGGIPAAPNANSSSSSSSLLTKSLFLPPALVAAAFAGVVVLLA
ncbi:stellacyanin [Benincasa hispida]|uniref:stellacyanin n=1 Tax=Benincasa hispida TaxID=102211 RepID=UPI0018FFFBAC|nr:stellacyanin [Benincasa hispida]